MRSLRSTTRAKLGLLQVRRSPKSARIPRVARTFVERVREQGRRACFFATESCEIEGFARLLLGEQPVWEPAAWPGMLATHRRLREQIRRPRAKGVIVRRVKAGDLGPETSPALPGRVARTGMAGIAPNGADGLPGRLEPFHLPGEHRYFVAERRGQMVAFLSAVPVYARRGWLIEDVLRSRHAPNGTTEALIDTMMRDVADSEFVTLGLASLRLPDALRALRLCWFLSGCAGRVGGLRRPTRGAALAERAAAPAWTTRRIRNGSKRGRRALGSAPRGGRLRTDPRPHLVAEPCGLRALFRGCRVDSGSPRGSSYAPKLDAHVNRQASHRRVGRSARSIRPSPSRPSSRARSSSSCLDPYRAP